VAVFGESHSASYTNRGSAADLPLEQRHDSRHLRGGLNQRGRVPAERVLNSSAGVKAFCAALALALGCSREPQVTTNTIAPADPRPAATVTAMAGSRPALATAGSPPPASAAAPGTTFMTIANGRIDVQRLLPRGNTVFHVRNQTDLAHEIAVRGGTGSVTATLPANGRMVLQLLLGTGAYDITCTTPGHRESARFETYAAGVPLDTPVKVEGRP
jgi:hypothetical protein